MRLAADGVPQINTDAIQEEQEVQEEEAKEQNHSSRSIQRDNLNSDTVTHTQREPVLQEIEKQLAEFEQEVRSERGLDQPASPKNE